MAQWKKTFISAFTAQVLSILGFSFALPFLPFFIGDLGVTGGGEQAFWAGMVLSAAGLTFALSAPLWGILADRYGRKLMVCRAMFGGALVLLLMSFVQTVGQLMVCRLIQGALTGTVAASVALVASVVPQKRSGFALGMMQTAVFIGAAVGPFFGGVVADALGYRASFRFGGLLCLVGGLVVYFGIHEVFTAPQQRQNNHNRPGFKQIFLLRGFFVAVLIMFCVQFSNTMINPSFPLIVKEILPNTKNLNSVTGCVVATVALAAAFSAGVLGHVGDKLGHRKVLVGCCLVACLGSAGHYWAYSLNQLIVARILFGLAVAGMLPAANAMIHGITDQASLGKAYGLATSLSMLGVAAGPFTGGYLASLAGLRVPFLTAAVVQLILGLLIILFASGKQRRDMTEEQDDRQDISM